MASAYRLEQFVQNYYATKRSQDTEYEKFINTKGFVRYNFIGQSKNRRQWNELHEACKRCTFDQVQQYKAQIWEDGKPLGERFAVPCEGIPKNYIDPDFIDELKAEYGVDEDSDEVQGLLATRDPVAWARQHLFQDSNEPWEARWYQEIMLRCTSRRAVFRCGRRSGKSDALAAYCLFAAIVQPFYARSRETGKILYNRDGIPVQKPLQILIVTPRQTHADNLMAKIKGFLDRNPELGATVSSYVKSPYYIAKFKNGSKITCITSGTGTSASGLSARSFDADILVLDEANYMGAADLKAIMAILATSAATILRASSTPVGTQDFFWEWCENNPQYKAFWYPTPVVPDWEDMRLNVYADVETEDDFLHEYMALFSPPEQGVFRPDLVRIALQDYLYEDCQPRAGCQYSIGVDWNSNAGTEIFVMEYDPGINRFKAVDAENVPRSEWTQLNALTRIIQKIKKWHPAVVCVDNGYGTTQIELLKRYSLERGQDHPATKHLYRNLIPYEFSSKIDVADPRTGEINKKPAKAFMVQNCVRRFEDENFFISKHDETLQKQLLAYIVARYSANGTPVYGVEPEAVGDHRLDACMLSLVGLRLKFGRLDQPYSMATSTTWIPRHQLPYEGMRQIGLTDLDEAVHRKFSDREDYIKEPPSQRKWSDVPRKPPIPSRSLFPDQPTEQDSPIAQMVGSSGSRTNYRYQRAQPVKRGRPGHRTGALSRARRNSGRNARGRYPQ